MDRNTVYSWTQQEIKDFVSRKLDLITNKENADIIRFMRSLIFSNSTVNWESAKGLIDQYFPDYNFITQEPIKKEEASKPIDILPNAKQIQYECIHNLFRR